MKYTVSWTHLEEDESYEQVIEADSIGVEPRSWTAWKDGEIFHTERFSLDTLVMVGVS